MDEFKDRLDKLLLKELNHLKTERQELREKISMAEKGLLEVDARLVHVEGLLGPNQALEDDSDDMPLPDSRDIRDIAVDILKARGGEPAHYAELSEEILARGGDIPGIDAANTLLSRLVRDERFVRPKRGRYALKADYPGVESVGVRRRRVNGDNEKNEPL